MATTLRFRKASDKDFVMIPEIGRVTAGMVLEGRKWKKYAKIGLLEELPHDNPFTRPNPLAKDEDFEVPVKKAPPPPPEPPPAPPELDPEPEPVAEDQAAEEPAEAPTEEPKKPAASPKPSTSGKMKKRAAARRKR